MSAGASALSTFPAMEIAVASGDTFPIESLRAGFNRVLQMQEEELADGTYAAEPCLMDNPFSSCVWDFVVAAGNVAGDYQLTLNSESISTTTPIGRPALGSRTVLDVAFVPNTNNFTVRSGQAALNLVERFEDAVAVSGTGCTSDGVYTNLKAKGPTPYDEYLWDITKSGNVYTIAATASS